MGPFPHRARRTRPISQTKPESSNVKLERLRQTVREPEGYDAKSTTNLHCYVRSSDNPGLNAKCSQHDVDSLVRRTLDIDLPVC